MATGQARAGVDIDPDLIGSTYSREDLLTALYLENAYLRNLQPITIAESALTLPTARELASDSRFRTARAYLELTHGASARHLVVANGYPDVGSEYGNGFVHRRVRAYQEYGAEVDVVAFAPRRKPRVYTYDGVHVLAGGANELLGILGARSYESVSAHFLNEDMWNALYPARRGMRLFTFLHGFEADRWIRRKHDIATPEALDAAIARTLRLQAFWQKVASSGELMPHFIYVSDWWRQVVADDMAVDIPTNRTSIIHNVTDTDLFRYTDKQPEDRFKLLWVRSAKSLKYGADLAIACLERLKATPFWAEVSVTILGDGTYFDDFSTAFGDDPNVTIERGFASQERVAELHRAHGISLVPTRYDSQGVSRDEAMASGLVPVTNAVAAVPEFVDDSCAILAPAEDSAAMAAGLIELFENPERFLAMSRAAAERVTRQSGPAATVRREAELFSMIAEAEPA